MTNDRQQPAPHFQIDDFLSVDAVAQLLQFVGEHEEEFHPSGVLTATTEERPEDIRRSWTMADMEPVWPLLGPSLNNLLPVMRQELATGHFSLDRIERQLTVHLDGDFFGPHNDSGGPEVASRRLTYVYYFNRQPKRFSGGELRLYHSVDADGAKLQGTEYVTIEPRHNSIVFFPSWVHHEVLQVGTDVDGLDGARMTITGWFHDAQPAQIIDFETRIEIQSTGLRALTESAFEIRKTPAAVHDALVAAHEAGRADAVEEPPDPMVLPTGEPELIPIGDLGDWVGEELLEIHQDWCGQALEHTATYGIRTYRNGHTLRRHCDRVQTHVVSSVVHLDHDGSPWPLVIEDHSGTPHEVVLEPGEMLLYESARCPHGRPTPFDGTHYSSVFVHFRPVDGWEIDEVELFAAGAG